MESKKTHKYLTAFRTRAQGVNAKSIDRVDKNMKYTDIKIQVVMRSYEHLYTQWLSSI